ncbi:F-box and FNIP repeat-containing protein [Bandra megavirus]|uniref:F-box and FNIP repeat-containing protein n=1 Tax=Bandra megavirus TaxID=2071566 RepID=A0A2K9V8P0_9VIRU|nr:F-box and FNIP repeat-containing protein [Bandra megavirus]
MSITDILNIDIIMCILDYLQDYDKMNFMMTCKEYYAIKNYVNYINIYEYNNVKLLPFRNKFKRLIYRGKIPNNNISIIKNEYLVKNLNKPIPDGLTHLKFEPSFNQDVKNCIPNSVIHLVFGWNFNQDVKDCIPYSVTHLTFGHSFNQNIKNCIPNSVRHLTFGRNFYQNIQDCVPYSVTHLTFNREYDKNIKLWIPSTVTHLLFLN